MTQAYNTLARRMIAHAPDQAAARLETLDPAPVAAYLASLESDEAAILLTSMMPGLAARVTAHMRAAEAGVILSAIPAHSAGAILRGLETERREECVTAMRGDRGRLASLLAEQPGNTAAAWMHTDIAILADDITAGQARRQLAEMPDSDMIYITTRDHSLRGHLTPARLLRLGDDTPIAGHIDAEPYRISASTRLSALIDHAGWQARHVLPVLDSHQQIIGALYHNDLYRGLQARNRKERQAPVTSIQDLGRLYAGTLLALFETAGTLLQADDRQQD